MMEFTAGPPRVGRPSTRTTLDPNRAASRAAETPEIPAPTTQMSAATCVTGLSLDLTAILVGRLLGAPSIILDLRPLLRMLGGGKPPCSHVRSQRRCLMPVAECTTFAQSTVELRTVPFILAIEMRR